MPLRAGTPDLDSDSEGKQNPQLLGRDDRKQSMDLGHSVLRRLFQDRKGTALTFFSLNPAAPGGAGWSDQTGCRRTNLLRARLCPGARLPSPRCRGGAEDPGGWPRRTPTPSSPGSLRGCSVVPWLTSTTDEVIQIYPCAQDHRRLLFFFLT